MIISARQRCACESSTHRLQAMAYAVLEHAECVRLIKAAVEGRGARDEAIEAWMELTREEKQALWIAPTKGGIFTTEERMLIRQWEWEASTALRRQLEGDKKSPAGDGTQGTRVIVK